MQARLLKPPFSFRGVAAVGVTGALLFALLTPSTDAAGSGKLLQRVRGTIGYQTSPTSNDFKRIVGRIELSDELYAVTQAQSAAAITLPDSSIVSLGENTIVKSEAFNSAVNANGSQISLNNGSLRFDIQHVAGGVANYRFVTTTSVIGVRGTVGLLSYINGVTTVGCLDCDANAVSVSVGTQTVSLVTGQVVTVSALGVITIGSLATVLGSFTTAGVPTTAQAGPVAAGLPASVGPAITGAIAAAAVAGSLAGAIATTSNAPAAVATPSSGDNRIIIPTPSPSPSPSPSPTATPTQAGNVNLNGRARTTAVPAAAPAAPVAAPSPAPAPAVTRAAGPPAGPMPGRFGR